MNNINQQHSDEVNACTKKGIDILAKLTPETISLMYAVVGLTGEIGELADAVKQHTIYSMPLDRTNVIEELGDIEFHLAGIRNVLDISRDEILKANMDKLVLRYPEGYSDRAAQERSDKKINS